MLLARPGLPRSPPWSPPPPILLPPQVSVCSWVSLPLLCGQQQLSFASWWVDNGSFERRYRHRHENHRSCSSARRSSAATRVSVPADRTHSSAHGEKYHGRRAQRSDDRSRSPVRKVAPTSTSIEASAFEAGEWLPRQRPLVQLGSTLTCMHGCLPVCHNEFGWNVAGRLFWLRADCW